MKTSRLFLLLLLLPLPLISVAQGFLISTPDVEFNGTQVIISYNIITKSPSDKFYVWVEMEKENGEGIPVKAVSGDIGADIVSGRSNTIIWVPSEDGIFLDEEILVEVKAEKYIKSFNKSSALLLSTAMPGLGQTKISNGKPWWITGVAAYGVVAGGILSYNNYLKSYDLYNNEVDASARAELYTQTQKKLNLSSALLISGATIWVANVLWVALTPNKYQPLQHVQISLNQSKGPYKGSAILSMKFNF